MDLGPQWPFWIRFLLANALVMLMVWGAVRHAGAARRRRAAMLGLLVWVGSAILVWKRQVAICIGGGRLGIDLPACDWEYQPAPCGAGELVLFIVAGGAAQALWLGLPLAAAIFAARYGFLRLRRAAR
jgi:hypothetical protein